LDGGRNGWISGEQSLDYFAGSRKGKRKGSEGEWVNQSVGVPESGRHDDGRLMLEVVFVNHSRYNLRVKVVVG
jgi:hypothetical protein